MKNVIKKYYGFECANIMPADFDRLQLGKYLDISGLSIQINLQNILLKIVQLM